MNWKLGRWLTALLALQINSVSAAYEIVPHDDGGLNARIIVRNDGGKRSVHTHLMGVRSTIDVTYLLLTSSEGDERLVAQGEITRIRSGEYKSLTGDAARISGNRNNFTLCTTSRDAGSTHVAVRFFTEPASVQTGAAHSATSYEQARQIRLASDTPLSCTTELVNELTNRFPHEQRVAPPEGSLHEEHVDLPQRESIYHLMTYIKPNGKFSYDVEIITPKSLSDVRFRAKIEPEQGSAKPVYIGTQLGYFSPGYVLEPRDLMGIDVLSDELPSNDILISACAAYFDIEERRFLRESWTVRTSLSEQKASPEKNNGRYHYPDSISWTSSGSQLDC